MKQKLFTKNFTFLVLGQAISLFGNAVLRFALPLFILDQSGSAALFGAVSAVSFLPLVLMSPIGGILADRLNKQRIMVALDAITAALVLGFLLLNGHVPLAPLVVVVLMVLYGLQGMETPTVQSSLPFLVPPEKLMGANAATNLIQSLSGLLGPVLGGVLYGLYGLIPVMAVSCVCFLVAVAIELFIRIPHTPQANAGSVWAIAKADLTESFRFLRKENPVMMRVLGIVFMFNLFFSSMLVIGLPVLITQTLDLGSRMYGYAEGAMAAGGLAGGLLAGALGQKLKVTGIHWLLLACALGILPVGFALWLGASTFLTYFIIVLTSFLLMITATLFSVRMLAFVQAETPPQLIGKVLSCVLALSTCAQPIGQALYGMLFERFAAAPWILLFASALVSGLVAVFSKAAFRALKQK